MTDTTQATETSATGSLVGGGAATPWQVDVPQGFNAPEQFVSSGKVDLNTVFKSYGELQARAGDPVPDMPEKYQYNWGEGEEKASDEDFKSVQTFAHKLGLTPQQFAKFVPESRQYAQALSEQIQSIYDDKYVGTPAKAESALRQVWQDSAQFDKQIGFADKAVRTYVKEAGISQEDAARLGNDPAFIRIMAAIGPELGEDSRINVSAIMSQETLAEIQSHPGYMNPNHPMHASLQAKAMGHFQNQAKMRQRAP